MPVTKDIGGLAPRAGVKGKTPKQRYGGKPSTSDAMKAFTPEEGGMLFSPAGDPYTYKLTDAGAVEIVSAPSTNKESIGAILTEGTAFDAIKARAQEYLAAQTPVSLASEYAADLPGAPLTPEQEASRSVEIPEAPLSSEQIASRSTEIPEEPDLSYFPLSDTALKQESGGMNPEKRKLARKTARGIRSRYDLGD